MTLSELKEIIDELVRNGTEEDTEICIAHYFDDIRLVESIWDLGSTIKHGKDVITIEGNGENITLING